MLLKKKLLVLRAQVPGHTQEKLVQKTQMVLTWHTVSWLITPVPLPLPCLMVAGLTTRAGGEMIVLLFAE